MGIDLAKELEGGGHPDTPRQPREEPKAFRGMQKAFGVTFRDLQARNRRRSFVLAGTLVLLLGALGASLGGIWGAWPIGLAIGVVIALIQFAVARQGGPTIVMKAMGARRLDPAEDPQLRNVVEEMAIAAGLPCPEIWVIPEDAPNAFATGFKPERSAVAITTALRERLSRDELQAVIAHELGHIKNGDSGYMVLMAVLVGSVLLLCDAVLRGRRGYRMLDSGRNNKGAAPLILVALLLAILAPILSRILQAAVSREREYLADATAVELARQPEALVSALTKLSTDKAVFEAANRGTQHLFIVNPMRAQRMGGGWTATHPPLEKRIQRIRGLYL